MCFGVVTCAFNWFSHDGAWKKKRQWQLSWKVQQRCSCLLRTMMINGSRATQDPWLKVYVNTKGAASSGGLRARPRWEILCLIPILMKFDCFEYLFMQVWLFWLQNWLFLILNFDCLRWRKSILQAFGELAASCRGFFFHKNSISEDCLLVSTHFFIFLIILFFHVLLVLFQSFPISIHIHFFLCG